MKTRSRAYRINFDVMTAMTINSIITDSAVAMQKTVILDGELKENHESGVTLVAEVRQ